jgi:hypothetical protein
MTVGRHRQRPPPTPCREWAKQVLLLKLALWTIFEVVQTVVSLFHR